MQRRGEESSTYVLNNEGPVFIFKLLRVRVLQETQDHKSFTKIHTHTKKTKLRRLSPLGLITGS